LALNTRRFLGRLPTSSAAAAGRLAAASAVLQVGFFVATVLVARAFGPTALGTYSIAIAIGAIVVSGAGSGLPALALRETSAGRVDADLIRRYNRTQLAVTGLASLAACAAGVIFIGSREGLVLGGVSGLSNVAQAQFSLVSGIRAGMHDFRHVAIAQVACGCAVGLLSAGAVLLGRGVTACVAMPGFASLGCTVWLARPLAGREWGTQPLDKTRIFGRSVPFIGIGMVNGGYQRLDVLVLGLVAGVAAAGTYASAYRFLGLFAVLARGFGMVFFARLSAGDALDERWQSLRRRGARLFALTIVPPALICAIAMPAMIDLVFGPHFASSTTPARLLLLSLIPYALYLPNAHALNAGGRESALFRVLLVGMVIEAVLVAVLGHAWGASGAAVGWCLSELVVLGGVARQARRLGRPAAGPT
jgi:O-antigen/teichoic acid export membrane protein